MKKVFFLALVLFMVSASFAQAANLGSSLSGLILLQVEQNGEAWYVYPENQKRYYLGRPDDAFSIMRELGLGIKHSELVSYQKSVFPARLSGLILLDVEQNGEAYYIYPKTLKSHYLGRPVDAFSVMRELGLGITDANLNSIVSANTDTKVSVNSHKVVDTNQSTCYNATAAINCPSSGSFHGQDAQYAGVQPSYTNNSDGTVTDNNTGLMWLQDAGDKVFYYNAQKSISYAGYNDWRIPTIKELYSLMDFSGQDIDPQAEVTDSMKPFINDDYFVFEYGDNSIGDRTIDSQWITSNIYVADVMGGQECFFGVNFADGRIKCYPTNRGKGYFARYVRGGSSYGTNAFSDNANATITDNSSGLTWQQNDSGKGLNWEEALSYCENLNLAGQTDWRLPNAKELQYIVDYSRSPDTTNSPAIDPIFNTSSITNEAKQIDYPFFWTSTTHVNAQGGEDGVYISFGRALGYMSEFGGWVDVHGAGAQRSDPKTGDPGDWPTGFGPQGDARRVYNYARCVRGGEANPASGETVSQGSGANFAPTNNLPTPPAEAIAACAGKLQNSSCNFQGSAGTVMGTCKYINTDLACVP